MSKTAKKSIAVMLVILQLIVLLPTTALNARAADPVSQTDDSQPVLNDVIEGTVRFGSFNYTGDTANNRDGIDYVSPFYYSDDYFSPSAVNPNANAKTMDWTALEDPSMVTLSHAFTVAVYGSSEDTVPVDWTHKSKNGEKFLGDCGFGNIFVSSEFNQQTDKDTLGYMFGTKEITVWDAATQSNKTFTLVAIGVRGAGYGAEWASNITIGDSNGNAARDKSYSGTYRHKGFDDGAKKVLADLDTYTAGLSGDVKYWVVGYSRAGAVANLVAGDITKQAAKYKTSRDNVYGYTFESAAGALKSEDPNGANYPNIHNIINPMDAVPRVSPGIFNHSRLGVDYRLPYHGNTTAADNTSYYNNMYAVLPTVAAIADIYNRSYTGRESDNTQDPVLTDSDPATYPYNRTIQIKEFGITNFNSGFVSDKSNADSVIAPSSGLYLDQFLDQFVDAFLKCIAWDYEYFYTVDHWIYSDYMTDRMTKDPMSHEQQYVKNYQEALRTLAGDALKQPGMGLGALDGIMDKAMGAIDFQTIWNGAGIAVHYGEMNTGIRYNRAVTLMIEPLGDILIKVIDELDMFETADLPEVHAAIRTIMPVLTWLYCEDHHNTGGEYLGTVFANVSTILAAHVPEQGISWDMSLDDVFISDYREITIPQATVTNVYEFRAGLDDALSANGKGALVASVDNGALTSKDDRITVSAPFTGHDDAGVTMPMVTIRYPGNLDLRFDVTPAAGESFDDIFVALQDYAPKDVVNVKSVATRASNGNISADALVYDGMTQVDTTASANEINTLTSSTTIPMSDKDTLHVMAWHGRNQVSDSYESTYDISKTVYVNTIVEGQFRQDADGETYLPYVMDQTGAQFTCAEIQDQITYTAALYGGVGVTEDGFGSKVDVSLPTVADGNTVVKYFITDASAANDQRLSSDAAPYDTALTEETVSSFSFGTNTDRAAVLAQTDTVYHVFYNGDFQYTVTWKNDDGTVLETDENVKYNAQPSYDGAEPTKQGDDHTVYTFTGWTPEPDPVTADVIYVATYDETKQYTVTWLNEDGSVLGTTTVNEGETPVYAGELPTKAADAQYTYAFSGWEPALQPAAGDAAYTAVFEGTLNSYAVRFMNFDGTELQTVDVPYGETPVYTGETPAKAADAQYTYTFSGWDSELAPVTGEAVYTAQFAETVNTYTITWLDMNGDPIDTTTVAYGEMPTHADPTMAGDAEYSYTFETWSPALEPVTGDAEYMAIFTPTVNTYTVTWLDEDGTLLGTDEVAYGQTPSRADPFKEADENFRYEFAGWTPEVEAVTGDVTYTATYRKIVIFNVAFQAPDVQDNDRMVALTGVTDSATVQQQPNYPSYMGYVFTGVTVSSGDVSEVVPCDNGVVSNAALNAALDRVFAASDSKSAMVTANYEQDTTQTYTVALKYQMPDGTVIDNVTLEPNVVGDAVKLTTGETFTDGENVYYFDHWLIDGKEYKSQSVTLRPEKAGAYEAVAVYVVGESAANEPVLQVVNAYAEEQNGIAKTAVTLSYSVPADCTVQAVGFRVSTKDPTLQTTYSTSTSKLTTSDGSYTVHVNVNTKREMTVYICAYLTYNDAAGTSHTILTDPVGYVWKDMQA